MFAQTYFSPSLFNPLALLERWLNAPEHFRTIMLHGSPLQVSWTRRAERMLCNREKPLIVEMQIYFSCVVKKRVLFHQQSELQSTPVTDKIAIMFRAVQATACDPLEFASGLPVQQELTSQAARQMQPASVVIDYRKGKWAAEFTI